MLLELISEHINKKLPLYINWDCNICRNKHNGNLLGVIKDVKDEYNLEVCRPDIALINEAGIASIIIEIVHKHEPENNVIDYCTEHNIILIRIKLDTIDDLENIENRIMYPSNVWFFNPLNCPNYYRNYLLLQQQKQQQQINVQINQRNNRISQSGPTIEQIEASHERDRKRRQYFAIKNNYRNKYRKK